MYLTNSLPSDENKRILLGLQELQDANTIAIIYTCTSDGWSISCLCMYGAPQLLNFLRMNKSAPHTQNLMVLYF